MSHFLLIDVAFLTRLVGLGVVALPVAYGSLSSISSSISAPPSLSTITIADQIFVVDPANVVLDSATVLPGSAGISIDGHIVSADAAHDLFVDGTEILAEPISSNFASKTAINNITSLSSSNVTSFGSATASSGTAAASGFNILGGEIAQIAVQAARKNATNSATYAVSPSISTSTSVPTASSDGSTPSGPTTVSPPSSIVTRFSLSKTSPAGAVVNGQVMSSQSQSTNTILDSMSTSTPNINLIATDSSIHGNSTSVLYAVPGSSNRSQTVSSNPQSTTSESTASQSAISVPGAHANSITTGPTLAAPTTSLIPTGFVASSQGMLLVGQIFGITKEAKTLSAIIKDDGPKESFISKLKGTDDDILSLLEDLHPPSPPPSYEDACLDGGSILDPVKELECLNGAFDEIISDLKVKDVPPDIAKIQTIFGNIGKLAENLEKEEEDDDDDDNVTSTEEAQSQASGIPNSATKELSTSTNSMANMTSTALSPASSSMSTASASILALDRNPMFDPDTSDYSAPDIADQVFMAFLGSLFSSAIGIGPGPSGFAVVIGNATATTNSSSSAVMTSLPDKVRTSSFTQAVSSVAAQVSSQRLEGMTTQVTSTEAASLHTILTSTATTSKSAFASNGSAGFAALGGEIAQTTEQIGTIHPTLASETIASSGRPIQTGAADAAQVGAQIGAQVVSILNQVLFASALALDAENTGSVSLVTSSSLAPPPEPSPPPTGPKWGIFLAYQVYTWGGANAMTDYYYKIWMTDLTKNPAGPDFCAPKSWITNVQIDNEGAKNVPPYPTKDFDFAIPSGIAGPAAVPCIWQPSPGNSQPGSMACNPGESVLCTVPATTAVTCKGDNPDRIEPLAQCVFQ